jgi:esterase/lipase
MMGISSECQRLLQEESRLYKNDYHQYYLKGESKPRSIGEPYLLHHFGTTRGILLIHGLLAAPEEVREWAEALHAEGYSVYAPRLAGHGTSALDLATRSYEDWVNSVNRGYRILKKCCDQIVVAGFSTGGGLALYSAVTRPHDFMAVISVSAPYKFESSSSVFAESLDRWNVILRALGIRRLRRDFVANDPDNPHINYLRCPVRSIVQVKAMMRKVSRALKTLTMPALIIQADRDPKVAPESGRKIYSRISSTQKKYREISFHLHGIVRGDISREVQQESSVFLNRLDWR